jgi:hypothetical protein
MEMVEKEDVAKGAGFAAGTAAMNVLAPTVPTGLGALGTGAALSLAGPVGGVIAAMALLKNSRDKAAVRADLEAANRASEKGPPTPLEKFEFLLARLMFEIDGAVSDEERAYLDVQSPRFQKDVKDIEEAIHGPDAYRCVKERFEAVKTACGESDLASHLETFADLDHRRTAEEVALLVQILNMFDGGGRLNLYVTREAHGQPGVSVVQGFFNYIDRAEYEARCGSIGFPFESRVVYVEDPFDPDRLIPLDDQAFEDAQERFLDGLLLLLAQLGAKNMTMSLSSGATSDELSKGKVEVSGGAKGINGSVTMNGSSASFEDWRNRENVAVTFDGSGLSLSGRLFPGRLKNTLLRRHQSNKLYVALIQGRFRSNRIKKITHELASDTVDRVSRAIKLASKLSAKVAKGQVGAQAEKTSKSKTTFNRKLTIEFY